MSSEKLYSPLKVGAITAANRIFMAPLTRLRSIEPGDIPTPLMAEYYRQRASAGLIISEATQISAQAKGYAGAPGIHSPEQIAAWKKITAGVHAENGHMAVQLWHTGRISHFPRDVILLVFHLSGLCICKYQFSRVSCK